METTKGNGIAESMCQSGHNQQQTVKTCLSLSDFTTNDIIAELKRRGWHGTLNYYKTLNV